MTTKSDRTTGGSSDGRAALLDAAATAEDLANAMAPADRFAVVAVDIAALRLLASHARESEVRDAELDAWKRLAMARGNRGGFHDAEDVPRIVEAKRALRALGIDHVTGERVATEEPPVPERRAPVQSDTHDPQGVRLPRGAAGSVPGTIAWTEHLEAYAAYARRYGTGQSAERLAERGGFGWLELVGLLGYEPRTWEPR